MPDLDGLETLRQLRGTHPRLPVIMFSALTERGAATTLDALALGATDFVAKPAASDGVAGAAEYIRAELTPRVRFFGGRAAGLPVNPTRGSSGFLGANRLQGARPRREAGVEAVVMGASTGGPNVLNEMLEALPADYPAPLLIVQHMPASFTKIFADRLDAKSPLTIREAAGGEILRPGEVWIAPGGRHMVVEGEGKTKRLRLHDAPPENSCRPAVDVLFRAAADAYGDAVLAIVLTGMGRDGLRGCECVREAGGRILAQDEASSVVWGMPGFVARAGYADKVLPPAQLVAEMIRQGRTPRISSMAGPRP